MGAKGVLVNITAGDSFTVGEYNQVGEVINQFASEEATVVIGTVIDSDLDDEFRVTVVATGIGSVQDKDDELELIKRQRIAQLQKGMSDEIDVPATLRGTRADDSDGRVDSKKNNQRDDYLDIPAFLRQKAD